MPTKRPATFCKNPLTIKDFNSLPQEGEAILLDDESLDTMYYVQETLRRLEPEGMDDVRTLRIETIGLITWKHFEDIHTIATANKRAKIVYYPCKDDNYPSDDEQDRCLIRHLADGRWQYWMKRLCPYPWFNLAKAGAQYAILPAWQEY